MVVVMAKTYFYRINAADFFTAVKILPMRERAKWVTTFAEDLVAGHSMEFFTQSVIDEAKNFSKAKSLSGKKGMESRYKKPINVITPLEQCYDFVNNENLTNNNNNNNKEERLEKHPPSVLMELWNQIVKSPSVSTLNKTRESKARLRLKENDIDDIREALKKITESPFLSGDNDRGWRADFDWLISNDTNLVKILEGKYDVKKGFLPRGTTPTPENNPLCVTPEWL
jgi:hypothetical protein